jgi:DNA-binding response OmpR family regulator
MDFKENKLRRAYNAPRFLRLTPEAASTRFEAPGSQPSSEDTFGMRALLLTGDDEIFRMFRALFSSLQIATQCSNSTEDALAQLGSRKFEAIVLDFDTFTGAFPSREELHRNRANRHLVIFAIASEKRKPQAFQYGASFIFGRPLEEVRIAQILRTAYGLMLRDRREYFRFAVELPISLRSASGHEVQCKTINLSRNGMAVQTPSPLQVGELVQFSLRVSEIGEAVYGTCKVVWDDQHGKAGLCFQGGDVKGYARFSAWIDDRFYASFDIGAK